MPLLPRLIGYAGTGLVAATLIGLVATRRYRLWYSFVLYLVALFVPSLAIAVSDRFYGARVWSRQELLLDVLRLAMASELAVRIFQHFPGARAMLRRVVVLVAGLTLLSIWLAPRVPGGLAGSDSHAAYRTFVGEIQPRVLGGAVWLFTAIAALVLWYRLPVQPFHKAVLLGYVPYLLVFTTAMKVLADWGWERGWQVLYIDQIAFVSVLALWTWAAWRTDASESF